MRSQHEQRNGRYQLQGVNSTQWKAKRRALREQYRNRCAYCNRNTGGGGTVDHYIPRALGGGNCMPNLRWSCLGCNNLKADMNPVEWEKVKPPFVAEPETRAAKRQAVFEKLADMLRVQRQQAKA